ncbi:hypothetical protein RO3G_12880 [Rhizopus delemar RA 99-880]|uniref:Uncharacterized protein n=1 Tax=Rhizopus delemar (strain RA 99-880 / ATCC MYA-4621 / FGSC 9543 / NRRL 43880) TaxID=246409 RepID=I1CI89_RHIO9|nr:hypothetical protein RO3G_12880 [Rhizopus delemar RA 99-880]|eukprot:EIE88169.1 hypothetical protein RO3G_12880 [Rhizopus delemar RA 99-880]
MPMTPWIEATFGELYNHILIQRFSTSLKTLLIKYRLESSLVMLNRLAFHLKLVSYKAPSSPPSCTLSTSTSYPASYVITRFHTRLKKIQSTLLYLSIVFFTMTMWSS